MHKTKIFTFCLVALLILSVAGVAMAGSSARFDVFWHVLSGGGASATAGSITLNGALGQSIIGESSSANYDLSAGYWLKSRYKIIFPLVMK